ncbi:uncharacterized protein LOC123852389 isoform X2 [Mirounga angustirostris]|uniref:uncharacterized protein LOC123852389 isoform X2 n=1 Tax=Mirounga angustirostris TaxID=9716 RepID=UPI00313BE3BB
MILESGIESHIGLPAQQGVCFSLSCSLSQINKIFKKKKKRSLKSMAADHVLCVVIAGSPIKACNTLARRGLRGARQRLPGQRLPRRRLQSACLERWALSRAAASRGLAPRPRAPGGLARAVGAVAAARRGRLRRRGGCGAESRPPRPARSRSGMEVLDEFDSEFPQSVTFCQLISEEDFERQAATYTERALRRLFRSIDRNPALAERVVRKGKLAEYEGRGLLSFLWAKFFCAVQGELNCCNSMGALEMHQRLEQLKRSIHRVHLYSQDAKKKRRKPKLKKPEPVLLQDHSTSPCLPPALLPPPPLPSPATTMASVVAPSPPVYTMPRVFGPFPPLPSKSMENLEVARSEVKLNWPGLSSNPKRHMVDLTPLVLNPGGFHFSYLAGNSAHKLRCPGFPWYMAERTEVETQTDACT